MTDCICGRLARDERFICDTCTDWLADTLASLPHIEAELGLTLTKQRRFDSQTGGARGNVETLPFNVAASRALARLDHAVTLLLTRCGYPRDGARLFVAVTMLLPRVDHIAAHQWAADTVLELDRVVAQSIRVIDRPPSRNYAGPCDQCGHDLYAVGGKPTVTCRECGIEYNLTARREWLLARVHDQLATAVEISRALTSLELPVTADRIRQWKTRERIEVKAHDRIGRPLYRVGDVVDLLVEAAQRASA